MIDIFVRIINVSIAQIRHDDLSCYNNEGWGGTSIDRWPIYNFYRNYLLGNKKTAREEYCRWYAEQLQKYGETNKRYGGMFRGSLYTLINSRLADKCLSYDYSSGDEKYNEIVRNAICERVMQRFALAECIAKEGYDSSGSDWIMGIERDGLVYLKNGHHRCAVLKALGFEVVNNVCLCRNYLHYRALTLLRRIVK
ncbi:MAG: hypothetical protein WC683_00235 [bacterium]